MTKSINKIKARKAAAKQRAKMTQILRDKIKRRDNYTCQYCGLSTRDEPNLLLEIDHIIPVSRGGLTTEDNLQTLCWICNRRKSNKIITDPTEIITKRYEAEPANIIHIHIHIHTENQTEEKNHG